MKSKWFPNGSGRALAVLAFTTPTLDLESKAILTGAQHGFCYPQTWEIWPAKHGCKETVKGFNHVIWGYNPVILLLHEIHEGLIQIILLLVACIF